jgi:hypothetical protein
MVLQEVAWIGGHGTYPEVGIVPESKIVISIIEYKRPEIIMVHYSHEENQRSEKNQNEIRNVRFLDADGHAGRRDYVLSERNNFKPGLYHQMAKEISSKYTLLIIPLALLKFHKMDQEKNPDVDEDSDPPFLSQFTDLTIPEKNIQYGRQNGGNH